VGGGPAALADCSFAITNDQSSSARLVAAAATMQKRGCDGRAVRDALVIGDRRVA
jgi:hypothetical protein